MDKKTALILTIFALAGVYFLGKGITGLVVSQSCCYPPNCSQENMCESARPLLESPQLINTNWMFMLGGVFILITIIFIMRPFHSGKNK